MTYDKNMQPVATQTTKIIDFSSIMMRKIEKQSTRCHIATAHDVTFIISYGKDNSISLQTLGRAAEYIRSARMSVDCFLICSSATSLKIVSA